MLARKIFIELVCKSPGTTNGEVIGIDKMLMFEAIFRRGHGAKDTTVAELILEEPL